MNAVALTRSQTRLVVATLVLCAIAVAVALNWPRADALTMAMQPLIEQQDTDQSLVARAILDNYKETRTNASKWSGVYWGFTFLAATFSALAGLILKFEAILRNAELKKDVAALLSVSAALLITISTSGDFQRKWQANRIAASELERTAYELLANKAADPRKYFAAIGEAIHRRNLSVAGSMEQQKSVSDAVKQPTKDQQ